MVTTSEPAPDPRVCQAIRVLLAAAVPEPQTDEFGPLIAAVNDRGYLLPDEDDRVRLRYLQYLHRRSALLGVLRNMEPLAMEAWQRSSSAPPAFAVALATAQVLLEDARFWVRLARSSRPLRKKLDEADARYALPRKTFAGIYRAGTDLKRLRRLRHALRWFASARERSTALGNPLLAPVLELLDARAQNPPPSGSALLLDHLRYRWFSFRRRHHSLWKQAVFGVFESSGSIIADLRQPGRRPRNAPKGITAEFRVALLELARPGDVFITRHDDALSNLFLPGHWPHAALHFGSEESRDRAGIRLDPNVTRLIPEIGVFLESKKDGVRFRPPTDTLEVDALVVLRPPLEAEEIAAALGRAAGHAGKLYDFVFDFRNSDRLACTELVYRAYHGHGGLAFHLIETGGRLCLPAEELIHQALEQGFKVVAACGIDDHSLVTGTRAELALHRSRCGL